MPERVRPVVNGGTSVGVEILLRGIGDGPERHGQRDQDGGEHDREYTTKSK